MKKFQIIDDSLESLFDLPFNHEKLDGFLLCYGEACDIRTRKVVSLSRGLFPLFCQPSPIPDVYSVGHYCELGSRKVRHPEFDYFMKYSDSEFASLYTKKLN